MNKKQITGIVLLVIGIALIVFAVHSMNRINEAKGNVSDINSLISKNPVGKAVGGVLEGEASQYDTEVFWMLIGGIVIGIVGLGLTVCCRKKKRR